MALGPGKYDAICTEAREKAGADVCVLVVMGGVFGSGFSVQAIPEAIPDLPKILRDMARQIEESIPRG